MRSPLPSLAEYRRAELRNAPYRVALFAGLAGLAMIAGCQLLFPRLPTQVIDFLRVAFRLRDLGGVVLFNDYVAVYFCAFSAGILGLLGVVVGPREEHQLELLLSKPVPAADFLAARTWPVLAMTMVVGVALAAFPRASTCSSRKCARWASTSTSRLRRSATISFRQPRLRNNRQGGGVSPSLPDCSFGGVARHSRCVF